MLVRLEIRDFAVISNIVFEPGKGLNVISGETGAGKSLIVDAIGLIMGAKASRNLIRTGSPSAFAEAVFDCSDLNDEGLKKLKSASLAKRGKVQGISGTWHTPEAIKKENDKVKATKDAFKGARKAEAKYNAEWRRS